VTATCPIPVKTGSAQLLPRLLAGRTGGPVFLSDRRPTRVVAGLDLDPASGRARLSYRRAAELFRVRTGWTLHQLRHSALTHAAEDGTNLPLLLARSRHASVRSLERYARPGTRGGRPPPRRHRPGMPAAVTHPHTTPHGRPQVDDVVDLILCGSKKVGPCPACMPCHPHYFTRPFAASLCTTSVLLRKVEARGAVL
jgi:hypothetical protein